MQNNTKITDEPVFQSISEPELHAEKEERCFKFFWLVTFVIIVFSALLKLPTFNLPHKEGDEVAFLYLTKNWIETGKYTLKGSQLSKTRVYLERANRVMPVHPPMFPLLLRPFVAQDALNYAVMASWFGHFLTILAVALMGRLLFVSLNLNLTITAFSPLFWLPLTGIATDPIMTYVSGILWIDNLHAGFAALSVAIAMMASSSTRSRSMYILSGILLGFALLSKVTSAMIIPVVIFVMWVSERNTKNRIQAIISGAVPALLMSLPWYVPLYYATGDFLMYKGAKPAEYQAVVESMTPENLKAFEETLRCKFCEAGQATPWYYLLVKLPLIAPLTLLVVVFYGLFYSSYIRTLEKAKQWYLVIPVLWFSFVMTIALILHVYIHRRITILVASIYLMLYMLLALSEKYETLKKHQPVLMFLAGLSIIYGAVTGGFYVFNSGYAEIYSLPELSGLINLWGRS